jgi:hypothetical protein
MPLKFSCIALKRLVPSELHGVNTKKTMLFETQLRESQIQQGENVYDYQDTEYYHCSSRKIWVAV